MTCRAFRVRAVVLREEGFTPYYITSEQLEQAFRCISFPISSSETIRAGGHRDDEGEESSVSYLADILGKA